MYAILPFAVSVATRSAAGCRLIESLVDGLGRLPADEIHVRQVTRMTAVTIGKGITVRGTVRVRGTDQDVVGSHPRNSGPHAVAEYRGKPQQIETHDRDAHGVPLQHDHAGGQLAPLVPSPERSAPFLRTRAAVDRA